MTLWQRHPGVRTGTDLNLGARAADRAVAAIGSWPFIGIQTVVIAVWMVLNTVALVHHWDPYPWILLNLVFSTQAAYASPLILLASVRADNRRAEVATHTLENTARLEELLTANTTLTEEIRDLTAQVHQLVSGRTA